MSIYFVNFYHVETFFILLTSSELKDFRMYTFFNLFQTIWELPDRYENFKLHEKIEPSRS